jgi:hypothetical protein
MTSIQERNNVLVESSIINQIWEVRQVIENGIYDVKTKIGDSIREISNTTDLVDSRHDCDLERISSDVRNYTGDRNAIGELVIKTKDELTNNMIEMREYLAKLTNMIDILDNKVKTLMDPIDIYDFPEPDRE